MLNGGFRLNAIAEGACLLTLGPRAVMVFDATESPTCWFAAVAPC